MVVKNVEKESIERKIFIFFLVSAFGAASSLTGLMGFIIGRDLTALGYATPVAPWIAFLIVGIACAVVGGVLCNYFRIKHSNLIVTRILQGETNPQPNPQLEKSAA